MTIYHVSSSRAIASSRIVADGSEAHPFAAINDAAAVARAGDEIVVHDGVYRESVDPRHGGESDDRRIVYRAADGEHPIIKGSERVDSWERVDGDVWRAVLPNAMFGDFNPYARTVYGDWVVDASSHARAVARGDDAIDPTVAGTWPEHPTCHLGDVYLDGRSMFEACSLEEVFAPRPRTVGFDHGLWANGPIADADFTTHVWYARVDGGMADGTTTIWANFQGADPNEALVEINVRRTCFYPSRPQVNYITVRGFEMAHAATPWAPPTGDQVGLIGAHWSRGWIIEDNDIHDAKCSAISLGKEESTGDSDCTRTGRKSGYQYQMEAVFKALRYGWRKGVVGGHVVRGNTIHDCGQNGIVGHMGCAFSLIERNEIYRIAIKHEFWGHEIGGIKFHAAVDTVIRGNHVHDCTLGMWLDWQTQGTHIDANVFRANQRDVMIEVSHGPYTVSNNVFASPVALDIFSDGGAYVNNLIAGRLRLGRIMDRSTPYHFPHTTEVAGSAFVYGGDDRFVNNVFVKPAGTPDDADEQDEWAIEGHGTRVYTIQARREFAHGVGEHGERPSTLDDFRAAVLDEIGGDEEAIRDVPQPVWARANTYVGGARPMVPSAGGTGADAVAGRGAVAGGVDDTAVWIANTDSECVIEAAATLTFGDDGNGGVTMTLDITTAGVTPEASRPMDVSGSAACADAPMMLGMGAIVRTADLGEPRIVEERFEQADGSSFVFDADIVGTPRGPLSSRGPLASFEPGRPALIWSR